MTRVLTYRNCHIVWLTAQGMPCAGQLFRPVATLRALRTPSETCHDFLSIRSLYCKCVRNKTPRIDSSLETSDLWDTNMFVSSSDTGT